MALEVFQSGRAALESTRGTDLTPTRIIYFESATEEQTVATIRPMEHRGQYSPVYSAAAGPESNVLGFQGRMSYDDAIWWLNLFAKGVASGTGAGADKTWTFLPSQTTDDVKTATIQLAYSDTIATAPGYKYNGCFGQSFGLHFEKNDDGAILFNAALLVQKPATSLTAFTGSLTDRTTIPISANTTQVYIDSSTIGSTADPKVISVDWTVNLAPTPLYTLDGTTAPQAMYRPTYRTWTATIVRQYNAGAERGYYADKTIRKVRVKSVGGALGGSNYSFQMDLYGVWTARRTASVDGIITEELQLDPVYDVTSTSDHNFVVVNATASIT